MLEQTIAKWKKMPLFLVVFPGDNLILEKVPESTSFPHIFKIKLSKTTFKSTPIVKLSCNLLSNILNVSDAE